MAEQDKDRLADLLGAMAGGELAPEDTGAEESEEESEEPAAEPAAPTDAQGPASTPTEAMKPPKPTPPPLPATPVSKRAGTPIPVARVAPGQRVARPASPVPQSTAPIQPPLAKRPAAPEGAAPPPIAPVDRAAAPEPVPADEAAGDVASGSGSTNASAEGGVEAEYENPPDNAEAMSPAYASASFAGARRPTYQKGSPEALLHMKRTIIPILLTVGTLCILVVLLGFVHTPFQVFRKIWFAVPAIVIGFVLLSLGGFTMLQVKNELARKSRRNA